MRICSLKVYLARAASAGGVNADGVKRVAPHAAVAIGAVAAVLDVAARLADVEAFVGGGDGGVVGAAAGASAARARRFAPVAWRFMSVQQGKIVWPFRPTYVFTKCSED